MPFKTSDSIAEQSERKNARDNGSQPDSPPANTPPIRPKGKSRDASRIAAWRFQPGVSGNPSGRPKRDVAHEIAVAVFENNREALYKAFSRALLKGNAYAFKELADRAFGKLKERVEIEPYRDMTAEDLQKRLRELETQLGIPHSEPEAVPPSKESKPN